MNSTLLVFFTLLWVTFQLQGQDYKPEQKNAILMASAHEELAKPTSEKDSMKIYYYSFEEGRIVPFYRRNTASEEAKVTLVSVCEGNRVLLTAPDFGEDALYSWRGPKGFTAYSRKIMMEQVAISQGGFYNITIKRNNATILGKIKLLVKEKPTALATGGIFCWGELVKLAAAESSFDANYQWSRPPSGFSSDAKETIVEKLAVGEYVFYLTVTKNGCKAMDTARVEVRQIPPITNSKAVINEGESVTLTADNAGINALYNWRGPFLRSNNGPIATTEGLKVGKYIYELTVVKNGCSSINTAVVEVQKNTRKALPNK